MTEHVLEVSDLSVTFPTSDGDVRAVRDVSFAVGRGETLGIVGESGCGKSSVALAVLGLLPKQARVAGSITAGGTELAGLNEASLAKVRSETIAYIPQDPLSSLNPAFTVGWQVAETIWTRGKVSRADARQRAIELLELVGIPRASRRVDDYPHEFSGGMRQRVVIAIAMANDPEVIIADEPTTALDVTIQAQVLEALREARELAGASLVLITHDLGVVAGMADRVLVMYAGKPVETGTVETIFYHPRMPYTLGLLGSLPRLDSPPGQPLLPIPGTPPSLLALPPGCPFAPRCPVTYDRCLTDEPPLAWTQNGDGASAVVHRAACHRQAEIAAGQLDPRSVRAEEERAAEPRPVHESNEVLAVSGLVKHFPIHGGRLIRRTVGQAHAVCGVSFSIGERQTLGLVGESGCGKSTTARAVLQLLAATSGSVLFEGEELTGRSRRGLRPVRQRMQVVFQDPFASLDPRMPVGEIVAEPLRVHGRWDSRGGPRRVNELFSLVGLNPEHRNRYPHEFSGGQRQRVGIARALALGPKLMVLDEPVSALDVSIQAGVVNLLSSLRDQLGLAYLFIAHDLSVVRHISDQVAVMYLGKIVETGSRDHVYEMPSHPYTQALLSAVPVPDPARERQRRRILLAGDVPSALDPPTGCRFRSRCWKAAEVCGREEPELVDRGQGHPVACHFAEAAPVLPVRLPMVTLA